MPHVLVNCVECYSQRFLYEHILNVLHSGSETVLETSQLIKCDNMNDFVLDKAERLRDMEQNILPAFLRLQELKLEGVEAFATIGDTKKLWKHIEPHLKKALHTLYLREVSSTQWERYQEEMETSENTSNHMLGPKPFPLDRLMAIFYSIVEGRVAPTANIFMQITSLVSLHFLGHATGEDQIEQPKYKCLVSLDFIKAVSRWVVVVFNIMISERR
ncbi:ORC5-like protein [Mya arenaria]|uniref:ORC5-like protein n=1 Tax=Mya arenaria TaxID=6604 RepID=A0ABY7FYC3_MYAAR|nr:ORC5-like protein [Mya arenaria]